MAKHTDEQRAYLDSLKAAAGSPEMAVALEALALRLGCAEGAESLRMVRSIYDAATADG